MFTGVEVCFNLCRLEDDMRMDFLYFPKLLPLRKKVLTFPSQKAKEKKTKSQHF